MMHKKNNDTQQSTAAKAMPPMSRPYPDTGHLVRESLLEARFTALWRRSLLPGATSDPDAVWFALAQRYAEPHRVYHDRAHRAHCLEQLDLAAAQVRQPDEVEMAVWFHDVVNEPGRRDNEQRSADYFHELAGGRIAPGFIQSVIGLILATTHRAAPTNPDQRFICDIDLASFGCPWECFMRDSTAVKAEFTGTEEEYYRGKKTFLQAMLLRDRIFLTDFFHEHYEQQARENIDRLLDLIERGAD